VSEDSNANLSGAQKELLLCVALEAWYFDEVDSGANESGRSGGACLMVGCHQSWIGLFVQGFVPSRPARYLLTNLVSYLKQRAKQCKPNVVKSKAVPEETGALTQDHYEVEDFVSLDQCIVKNTRSFMEELVSGMLHQNTSMYKIRCHWELAKQSTQR
jgi:hypothetical protein